MTFYKWWFPVWFVSCIGMFFNWLVVPNPPWQVFWALCITFLTGYWVAKSKQVQWYAKFIHDNRVMLAAWMMVFLAVMAILVLWIW